MLLTAKPDTCFFCAKAGAVHFVPCCATWGPYAQWRLELAQAVDRDTAGAKVPPLRPPVGGGSGVLKKAADWGLGGGRRC